MLPAVWGNVHVGTSSILLVPKSEEESAFSNSVVMWECGHLLLCLGEGSVWRELGVGTTRSNSSLNVLAGLGCRASSLGQEPKL